MPEEQENALVEEMQQEPESQVEPAEAAEPEEEAAPPEPAGEEPAGEPVEKPTRAEKRIDQLTARRKRAEEEAAYWRGVAEARERQAPALEPPPQIRERPVADNFDTYEAFQEALTDWKVEVKLSELERKREAAEQERAQRQVTETFRTKLAEGASRYGDFNEVAMSPALPITESMVQALADCEYPADIVYYLGQTPHEAFRISRLSPIAQAREIGRIEARFADNPAKNLPAQRKKAATPPPPPIKPVKGEEIVEKDPSEMTQAEYERWRSGGGKRIIR